MIAYATYRSYRIQVFEIVIDRIRPDLSCAFINFGGPAWVGLNELSNIILIEKKKGA